MDGHSPRDLLRHFDELEDPRMKRTRLHRLDDILAVAILAVICGAEGWTDIEEFGKSKLDWLKTILRLPNGIPSHDTFGRVFSLLDPDAFERCFLAWVKGLIQVTGEHGLHIDGKTLRHSFDAASSRAAVHMISAWSSKAEMVLSQRATADKSNEITAIPELLDLISLHGAVVTIDAMGCQRSIVAKIIEGGGDYVLAVKDNQPTLHEDLKLLFDEAIERNFEHMGYDYDEQAEKGHGRLETRRVWVTRDVQWLRERGEWPGLRSVVCVDRERHVLDPADPSTPGKVSRERHYFISSLDHRDRGRDAEYFGRHIRDHWKIENQLHWSLDVSFAEDASRVRLGHAGENLSRLRRIALNLLKKEKVVKRGIACKRMKAGWDHAYLLKVLGSQD